MYKKINDLEILLPVKVIPQSASNQIVGWENGRLKVRLKACPEKNKANKELIKLLSKFFGITQADICMIQGEKDRHKKLIITSKSIKHVEEILKTVADL